jgi:hypothetical protein
MYPQYNNKNKSQKKEKKEEKEGGREGGREERRRIEIQWSKVAVPHP